VFSIGRDNYPNDVLRNAAQWAFRRLYHEMSWSYDLVAGIVSLGRWFSWIELVRPFVLGPRVLELGFGTGHLLGTLAEVGAWSVAGIDESRQMARITRARLRKERAPQAALVVGRAQLLPIKSGTLNSVVATFPADFIIEPESLGEIRRVLEARGRLVLLPIASLSIPRLVRRAPASAEPSPDATGRRLEDLARDRLEGPLAASGFRSRFHQIGVGASSAIVIVADPHVDMPPNDCPSDHRPADGISAPRSSE
jgi:SAM-dependent methyltransferase